jgi:hypothetical protein
LAIAVVVARLSFRTYRQHIAAQDIFLRLTYRVKSMKKQNGMLVSAVIVGTIMLPSNAFSKVASDCRAESAIKARAHARGATEGPYRDRCQADTAPGRRPLGLNLVAANAVPTTTAAQASSSLSKKVEQDCVAQYKADQQGIMARGMTEDSYVEQCLASNSAPGFPEPKPTTAPEKPIK